MSESKQQTSNNKIHSDKKPEAYSSELAETDKSKVYANALTADEIQAMADKSDEDIERYIEVGAYGKVVAEKMPESMRQRIRSNPELRKIRDEMKLSDTGATINGDQELMDELMAVFGQTKEEAEEEPEEEPEEESVGRVGLGARIMARGANRQARKAEKSQQDFDKYALKLEEQGYDEAEIEKRLKRHEKWRGYKRAIGIGAAAIGAYLVYREVNAAANGMGLTWFGFGGPGIGAREATDQAQQGGRPNSGPGNAGDLPQGNKNDLNDYFNSPDTSKMPNLHHANDFSPGNPDLSAMNKDGALKNLEDMFRGNPRITAMWASELHIPGAPNMPSVEVLENNPSAVVNYNHDVNNWGDFLQTHPDVRKDVTNQLVDALRNGSLGDKRTLDYGYLSSGSNNRPGQVIFGTTPGQVFIDSEVDYSNVEAVEWHVNGQTVLVETGCNQLAFQIAHPQVQVQQYHQPVYDRTYQPQPRSQYRPPVAPPVHYQSVTPPSYTPQAPPELPQTPQTPQTPQLPPEIPQTPQLPPETPQPPHLPPETPPPSPPPPIAGKGPEFGNQFDSRLPSGDLEQTPHPVQQEVITPAKPNVGVPQSPITDRFSDPSPIGRQSGISSPNNAPDLNTSGTTGSGEAGKTASGSLGFRP